jgi:hypothetical protein
VEETAGTELLWCVELERGEGFKHEVCDGRKRAERKSNGGVRLKQVVHLVCWPSMCCHISACGKEPY